MDKEDSRRIIIVEEDRDDQFLTKSELADSPLGDSIFFVSSLDELFKYLQPFQRRGRFIDAVGVSRPSLIFLNSYLPYRDLVKIIDEIHAIFGNDFPVAVMAISQHEEEYIKEFVHPDVIGYLNKPITVDQIVNLVGTLL